MKLFARDRRTERLEVPGFTDHWMVFQGLTGRKLNRSRMARLDSAVDAAGGPEKFKEQSSLFIRDAGGEDKIKAQKDRETVMDQFDPLVLGENGTAEWSLVDDDGKELEITEENIDQLPEDVRRWMVGQILELNGVIGKEAEQGNA